MKVTVIDALLRPAKIRHPGNTKFDRKPRHFNCSSAMQLLSRKHKAVPSSAVKAQSPARADRLAKVTRLWIIFEIFSKEFRKKTVLPA